MFRDPSTVFWSVSALFLLGHYIQLWSSTAWQLKIFDLGRRYRYTVYKGVYNFLKSSSHLGSFNIRTFYIVPEKGLVSWEPPCGAQENMSLSEMCLWKPPYGAHENVSLSEMCLWKPPYGAHENVSLSAICL